MTSRALSVPVFLLLFATSSMAAQAPSTPTVAKADYSKESFVIDSVRTSVWFENDGTGWREVSAHVRVQSDAGVQQFGLLAFGYSSANERLTVDYARVRKADGRVITTPAGNIQDMTAQVTRAAPMYSDYRERHVAVEGLGIGDVLEYHVRYEVEQPQVPGEFWLDYDFDRTEIVLEENLEIKLPKDRNVIIKSPDVNPAVTEQGDRRIYTWQTQNLERKKPSKAIMGQLPPPAIQLSSFRSWDQVGRWWSGLVAPQAAPTPEVQAKATELTKDAKSDEEKLRAIYNYVSTRFRYISLSFGVGRFQPHAAAEVLRSAYGDCKDKHTLLAALAKAAGVTVYPVLISSLRKTNPDVPSPSQFNHVISVTLRGNDYLWMDTTVEVGPMGLLLFNLRGKQALVISQDRSTLVNTPVESLVKNSTTFEAEGKLAEDGTLQAKIQLAAGGESSVPLRASFRGISQAQWKDLAQNISYLWGFAGTVSSVEASSPDNLDQPFHFSYDYTRRDYPDWANRRISPFSSGLALPLLSDDKEEVSEPIRLGVAVEVRNASKVELPKGYAPELPPSVNLVRDFAEYHASYSFQNGALIVERRLVIKQSELPAARREDYRSFQKAANDDENRYIALSSGGGAVAAPAPSPQFQKLYAQGRDAWERQDYREALDDFERAVKIYPQSKEAWQALGSLRLTQGETEGGLRAFRKAIEIDPKDSRSYQGLAATLMMLRRTDEAIAVWRDLLKQSPEDDTAHANLGQLLLGAKKYKEAVLELERVVAASPDSATLQLRLGLAYAGAGDTQKAVSTFQKAAELDPTSSTWNTIADGLALMVAGLADAERYAEMAVKADENEAAKLQSDTIEIGDLKLMRTLATEWDTLGRVYFREGKLEKAERYLHAAWSMTQNGVIGEHLAEVYEKTGKKAAATRTYAAALANLWPRPEETRVRLARLLGSEGKVEGAIEAAREVTSRERRADLEKVSAKTGSAEFLVLVSPGPKVEAVKFLNGDEHLRATGEAVASAKLPVLFPDDGPAKLLRQGVLVCVGHAFHCDFTLFTVDVQLPHPTN